MSVKSITIMYFIVNFFFRFARKQFAGSKIGETVTRPGSGNRPQTDRQHSNVREQRDDEEEEDRQD